jgi:hypothetical protein
MVVNAANVLLNLKTAVGSRKSAQPVSSINSSTLKYVSFLDTARLDELFDHTATSWYLKTGRLG